MMALTLLLHGDWHNGPFHGGIFHPGLFWLGLLLFFGLSRLSRHSRPAPSAPRPRREPRGARRRDEDPNGPVWPDLYGEAPKQPKPGQGPPPYERF